MIIFGWFAAMAAGFALAVVASARTIRHVEALAYSTRVPPFFIGITLMAIGTDLPEIANSIVASMAGHGDLNAGDSVGSAVTQATLVMGLLPLLAGPMSIRTGHVLVPGILSIVALALGALLMRDGFLSRADGALLLLSWVIGSLVIWRQLSPSEPVARVPAAKPLRHAFAALLMLALVGLGAGLAVAAFVQLSPMLGIPQYALSFFVSSAATSLPELIVDVTAIRAGLKDLALGDILGSSFVDASLSIGIGPLLFPVAVTPGLAVAGSGIAIGGIGLMVILLAPRNEHRWTSGVALIVVYLAIYGAWLGGAAGAT